MGHHYSSVLQWVGSSIAICRNLCSSLVWLLPPSPPQRLMLMPITADTATVTSLPGLLPTVLASNPPSTEPVDTPTDTARGVLTLMLMLTTAATATVDMVDTVLGSLTTDTAPLPTSTGLPRDSMATMDMVDTATSARGVLMLMLSTAMVSLSV